MLRSLKELLGYQISAKDDQIGKVHNFLFDDENWRIRYMVVDTGPWIIGRKVLISLEALGQPVWESKTFPVDLTREQVKNSPDVDLAKPVSRQFEERLHKHYHWAHYWSMTTALSGNPAYIPPQLFKVQEESVDKVQDASHLRSTNEMLDYKVSAIDGEVGFLSDFIVDDDNWQLRYMVTGINNFESEKQVLIAIEWLDRIDVARKDIFINLKQDAVKFSPSFDPTLPVNRQYEEVIYDYYGRPKYWQVVEPQQ